MKRTLPALALLVTVLAARPASAQVSIWLQRGVSGAGGAVSLATNDTVTTYGVSGGYSYEGYLEADLNLNYYSFNKNRFGGASINAFGIAPTIQFHPIKQTAEMPVSVGFSVGFEKDFFSGDFLPGAGISAYDVAGAVSVYRFFKLTSNVGIIPAAAFSVVHSWTTTTDTNGVDSTSESTNETLALGGYFAYIDDAGRIWGLVPSVTFGFGDGDSTTSFGIEVGLIISMQ